MKIIELTLINPDRRILEQAVTECNNEFSDRVKNLVGVSYQGKKVFISYKEEQDLFYFGKVYGYLFHEVHGQ
jgi:hypothetical protein